VVEKERDRFLAQLPEPERSQVRWEHVGSTSIKVTKPNQPWVTRKFQMIAKFNQNLARTAIEYNYKGSISKVNQNLSNEHWMAKYVN
jgi:hypothetical protein